MKIHIWSTVLLLGLFSCNNPQTTLKEKIIEPIPLVKYISTSAYPTAKMTENKKGYVFGEKMPDGLGKYTFTFYIDHITLKTDRITSLKIDKVDKRYYPNEISFFANDSQGTRYLINVSDINNADHTYIDFYDDFRENIFNILTKIICKKVN
jgi:hypothetical protein